jgi:heme a synthase
MVRSGLNLDPEQLREIRVSPYRLATHLGMAFTTYSVLLWTGTTSQLNIMIVIICEHEELCLNLIYLLPSHIYLPLLKSPGLSLLNTPEKAKSVASLLTSNTLKLSKNIRYVAIGNGVLVATTVLSGAFVAGNDAGRAFNTWPMMGDEWIPSEILDIQPIWRNFFENTATVQFDHRVLAMATLGGIWSMYAAAKTAAGGAFWTSLPRATRVALTAVTGMSLVQVGLGISTLLLYVPVPLAAVHQAGSLVLLTIITCAVHSLNFATHSVAGASMRAQSAQILSAISMVGMKKAGSAVSPSFVSKLLANSIKAPKFEQQIKHIIDKKK